MQAYTSNKQKTPPQVQMKETDDNACKATAERNDLTAGVKNKKYYVLHLGGPTTLDHNLSMNPG